MSAAPITDMTVIRTPKGQPTGGQFAARALPDSPIALTELTDVTDSDVSDFVSDWAEWEGDVDALFSEWDARLDGRAYEVADAYESYDGDVDYFVRRWAEFLNHEDEPCPATEDGIHQISDGSCDECGAKNY